MIQTNGSGEALNLVMLRLLNWTGDEPSQALPRQDEVECFRLVPLVGGRRRRLIADGPPGLQIHRSKIKFQIAGKFFREARLSRSTPSLATVRRLNR